MTRLPVARGEVRESIIVGAEPQVYKVMVKALARAFRWREMLDTGVHVTIEDLAAAMYMPPSYVSAILCLTLLSPDID